MTVVSIRFIASGYHATPWAHHVNEGAVEWPPSPWRLLRALIAVWKQTMPEVSDERMRRLLTALSSPPDFQLPQGIPTHTRHYMPLYGTRGASRTMVLDSYIALKRSDAVYFIWKGDLPDEDRELLRRLLENLPYFGRAESWCRAEISDAVSMANCFRPSDRQTVSDDQDMVRVLVPASDVTLEQLMVDTDHLRGRQHRLDPPGSEWALYALNRDAFSMPAASVEPKWVDSNGPIVVRYALDCTPLPPVTATVAAAELLRKAVMSQYGRANGGELSSALAGRDRESGPLQGNKHAYYLPTDEDLDGRLDHLVVYVPGGLNKNEFDALANTSTLLTREGMEISLLLLGSGSPDEPSFGRFFDSSTTWESATPFVLSRHPKRRRTGEIKTNAAGYQVDGAEDQIQREWGYRCKANPSLPRIASVERLQRLQVKGHQLSWLDFRFIRASSDAPSPAGFGGGFRITFASPVRGPIALGYAAHFGLGLFRPQSRNLGESHDVKRHIAGDLRRGRSARTSPNIE